MTKTLTIRTDEQTLEKLDLLASQKQRSRNFVANQALKDYVTKQDRQSDGINVPVAEVLEDYKSQLWHEDDLDDFFAFLKTERQRSLDERRLLKNL